MLINSYIRDYTNKQDAMNKTLLVTLMLLINISCVRDDQAMKPAKDVTFEIIANSEDLTLNDYYDSRLLQSAHRSHVDTCWIEFLMPHGTHEIELTINGTTSRSTFNVTNTTARRYRMNVVSFGISIDTIWGEIIDHPL